MEVSTPAFSKVHFNQRAIVEENAGWCGLINATSNHSAPSDADCLQELHTFCHSLHETKPSEYSSRMPQTTRWLQAICDYMRKVRLIISTVPPSTPSWSHGVRLFAVLLAIQRLAFPKRNFECDDVCAWVAWYKYSSYCRVHTGKLFLDTLIVCIIPHTLG